MKPRHLIQLLITALSVGWLGTTTAVLPIAVEGEELPSLAPMLERTSPAVVNIATSAEILVRSRNPLFDDPFFQRFFDIPGQVQPRSRKQQGLGSGVVIDAEDGLVLTNAHVIEGADEITVTLHDGRDFEAELIGADAESDIAVVRINADNLTAINVADSDRLRVGDFVVAIGNPFGLTQTVTSGIVSGLGRSGLGIEVYEDFIQTDASINPGNSGGALVNLRGELVGINTAIQTTSGGSVGIGFAIPTNMALGIKDQLLTHGEVRRGRLGVHIQDLTPELARAFDIEDTGGAVISQIIPGLAADKAGMEEGDVIIELNGRKVDDASDLRNTVGLLRVESQIDMKVLRDGRTRNVVAVIEDVVPDASIGETFDPRLGGAGFADLTEQQLRARRRGGVVVTEVEQGSAAWSAGLRRGDIIVSVNRRSVINLETFQALIEGQSVLLMNLQRGNGSLFLLLD
jgi:Do/DeqQ family serine protease